MEDDKSNIFATELWQKKEKVDIAQLCRACANPSDSLIAIFESEGIENDLSTKINKHLPIQVLKEDSLPTKLCYPCTSTLVSWHDMLVTCIEADKKLRSLVSSVGDPIPAASDDDDGCADDSFMDFMDDNNDDDSNDEEKDFTPDNKFVPEALASTSKSLATKQNDNSGIMSFDVIQDEIGPDTDPITSSKLFESDPVATTSSASDNLTAPTGEPDDERGSSSVNSFRKFEPGGYRLLFVKKSNTVSKSNLTININELQKKMVRRDTVGKSKNQPEKKNLVIDIKTSQGNGTKNLAVNIDNLCSKDSKNSTDLFKCEVCKKEFTKREYLQSHVSRHHDTLPYVCHICGKSYNWSGSIRYHLKHFHDGVKEHNCEICGRKFAQKSFLKEHLRTHTGEKPYVCETCGKAFTSSSTLRNHIMTHNNTFSFLCNVCGKPFKMKHQLVKHNVCHTKETLYSCDICGKQFSRQSAVKIHKSTHTESTPFSCQICHTKFKLKRYVRNHMRMKHKISKTTNPNLP